MRILRLKMDTAQHSDCRMTLSDRLPPMQLHFVESLKFQLFCLYWLVQTH